MDEVEQVIAQNVKEIDGKEAMRVTTNHRQLLRSPIQ